MTVLSTAKLQGLFEYSKPWDTKDGTHLAGLHAPSSFQGSHGFSTKLPKEEGHN